MALEKQDISLDLVHGAETKVNAQIDQDFQEMVNVVFDGKMTAKKMNGYNLLASLPSGEKFSLLARRQNDLISQTDRGTYKYIDQFEEFKKISEIGSCKIESNESAGISFGFSTDYRCFVKYETESRLSYSDGLQTISFYTHDGVFINELVESSTYSYMFRKKTIKVLSIGNSFFVCGAEGGSEESGANILLFILKFSLNVSTNEFEFVTSGGAIATSETTITGLDFFTDGTSIFGHWVNASQSIYFKRNSGNGGHTQASSSTISTINVQLFDKNSTEFYMTALESNNLKLVRVNKSTLAEISVATIASGLPAQTEIITAYPLSDTTAIYTSFLAPATGDRAICPVGKIFTRNGGYYMPIVIWCQNSFATVLVELKEGATTMLPRGISDTGAVVENDNFWQSFIDSVLVFQGSNSHENIDYFSSVNIAKDSVIVGFNCDASQSSSYLEIEKTLLISNGIFSYYDGQNVNEYGFIGNPYLTDYATTTGSLPADSGYMFCAMYEYTDARGNVFYSALSPIYSGFDPVNGITLPGSSRVTFNLQTPIISNKKLVKIKVYIKRKNKPFQLTEEVSFFNSSGSPFSGMGTYSINISSYPASDAEVAPYQDGSIRPETTTNSRFIGLYADRVFRISDDSPISLGYSQKKISGSGFEFNDSYLYLDILDKRGIAEDDLTGCIAMDGRLIIFKETSILYINGSGPTRANTQDDFSDPDLIVADVGCTQPRSIVLIPGGVMFKSDKGIYLLNRKLQAGYIGSNVEAFNDYTITSALLLEEVNEVRFSTLEGVTLVFNYLSNAWSWFDNMQSSSACIYKGKYTVLRTDGSVIQETSAHKKMITSAIVQTISSPWLRLKKIQGYQKAYYVYLLGDYVSDHRLKMKVYYDYELYSSEEYIITPLAGGKYNITSKPTNADMQNGTAINGVYQMKIDLIRKNCQAVRVVIIDEPLNVGSNTGECFALSNITVTVGLKKGAAKIQSSKSY